MATTPTHAYDGEYQSIYFRVYLVEVNDKKKISELSVRATSRIQERLIRVTVKRKELHKIKKNVDNSDKEQLEHISFAESYQVR